MCKILKCLGFIWHSQNAMAWSVMEKEGWSSYFCWEGIYHMKRLCWELYYLKDIHLAWFFFGWCWQQLQLELQNGRQQYCKTVPEPYSLVITWVNQHQLLMDSTIHGFLVLPLGKAFHLGIKWTVPVNKGVLIFIL